MALSEVEEWVVRGVAGGLVVVRMDQLKQVVEIK